MEKSYSLRVNPELVDEKRRILIKPHHRRDTVASIGTVKSFRMDQLLGALSKERWGNSLSNIALAVRKSEEGLFADYMMMTSNSSGADTLPPYLFQPGVSDISHRRKLASNENLWYPFIYTPTDINQPFLPFDVDSKIEQRGKSIGDLNELSDIINDTGVGFQGFFNPLHSRVIFPLGDRGLDIDTANHTAYKISEVNERQRFDLFK